MSDKRIAHQMKLQPNPFRLIQQGIKTIESRLHDEKRKLLRIGDTIEFTLDGTSEVVEVVIIGLHPEKTFKRLFEKFPAERFGGIDILDLMGIYKYYSKEDEQKYGVIGIEISHEDTYS